MIHRDDLERERQEALRASEERLLLALEASRMGTWEWDTGSHDGHASESTEALFGMSPGSFDGTPKGYLRTVHPEDLPAVEKELDEVLSGRKDGFEVLRDPGRWLHPLDPGRGSLHPAGLRRRINGTVLDRSEAQGGRAGPALHELNRKTGAEAVHSHDLYPLITVRAFWGRSRGPQGRPIRPHERTRRGS
jgi:PAS domain-containing protein